MRAIHSVLLLGLTGVVLAAPARWSQGQEADNAAPKNARNVKDDRLPGYTVEREAAALRFVEQHHPELTALLDTLREGNPAEYRRAIQDLFRTSERLAASRERDDARYELDLEAWKLDSRIRLLAARLTMAESKALVAELKSLMLQRADVQLQQQKLERQRLATRLERLDAAIQKSDQQREESVQRALDRLLSGIAESRPAKKRPAQKSRPNTPRETTGARPK